MVVDESMRGESPGRGGLRLVHDCSVVGRMLAAEQPPARERLRRKVDRRLAALLVSAPAGDQPETPGRQRVETSIRPGEGRIVELVPELPIAVVSLGTGRNNNRRKVSSVTSTETRAGKAARNEQLVRERPVLPETDARIELACECGDQACVNRVVLTPDEHAFLRKVPGYYAVSPEHVVPDDHVIVGEDGRFAIVE